MSRQIGWIWNRTRDASADGNWKWPCHPPMTKCFLCSFELLMLIPGHFHFRSNDQKTWIPEISWKVVSLYKSSNSSECYCYWASTPSNKIVSISAMLSKPWCRRNCIFYHSALSRSIFMWPSWLWSGEFAWNTKLALAFSFAFKSNKF